MNKFVSLVLIFGVIFSCGLFSVDANGLSVYSWNMLEDEYNEYIDNGYIPDQLILYKTLTGFGEFYSYYTFGFETDDTVSYYFTCPGVTTEAGHSSYLGIRKDVENNSSDSSYNYYELKKEQINPKDMRTADLPYRVKLGKYIESWIEYYYSDYGELDEIVWCSEGLEYTLCFTEGVKDEMLSSNLYYARLINMETAPEVISEISNAINNLNSTKWGEDYRYMNKDEYSEFTKNELQSDFVKYETLCELDAIKNLGELEKVFIDSVSDWNHILYYVKGAQNSYIINIRKDKKIYYDMRDLSQEEIDMKNMTRFSEAYENSGYTSGKYIDGNIQYIYTEGKYPTSVLVDVNGLQFCFYMGRDYISRIPELRNIEEAKVFVSHLEDVFGHDEEADVQENKEKPTDKKEIPKSVYIIGITALAIAIPVSVVIAVKKRKTKE